MQGDDETCTCSFISFKVVGGVHDGEPLFFLLKEKYHGYTEDNEKTVIFDCS